jgi:sugar/nucleoside kinase (ribokinase family)
MKSILTIGEILVEIMATDRGDGFLEPVKLLGPFPSGAPAIFIDQAAKFGQPAAIIGCVGNDDFGRVNLDRLRRDGVNVEGIRIDPETATGSAFVRYRPDGSRAFVYNIKHSASGNIVLDAAARAVLDRSDHLHVMGTSLFSPGIVEVVLCAADAIKARGGTISFDPNLRPEILSLPGLREACETLFRRCDVFLPSGVELYLFTNAKEEKAAVEEILAHGIKAIVHKRDEKARATSTPQQASHSQGSWSRSSIRPEPATASGPPSSVAGCATCLRPGVWLTPQRVEHWR